MKPRLMILLLSTFGPLAAANDLDDRLAQRLLEGAITYAIAHHAPGGAIAIVDGGGHPLALRRLDGTFPAAPEVAFGKARTAALFRKPTREFETLVNQGRVTMVTLPAITGFTPLQGGIPIEVDGKIVGAIGVSGAASAAQDEEIALAAVAAAGRPGIRP